MPEGAVKSGINQIMLSVIFASMSGINRLNKIAMFTEDVLVRSLIKLCQGINKDVLSSGLKKLGQAGSRTLQILLLSKNSRWLANSGLEIITLNADSTVKPVCGNQQGAACREKSKKYVSWARYALM